MLPLDEAYGVALREGIWLERPPSRRLVRLTGPQRIWFLQNTVTADVDNVDEGRWVESCFLDPKGRVQAHFRVGIREEEVWLDVAPDADRLAQWFQTYRFRTKVEIETVTRRTFTVLGPEARDVAPEGVVSGDLAFGYSLGDVPAVDVHTEEEPSGRQAPADLYDIFRIEAGLGAFGIDFGERDLPQEAGLTRAVSVEKGCYVGQETIARIHFRGHINKVLRPLRFDGEAGVGAELSLDGASVGRVTSVARSPRVGYVGIGMVRVEPPEGAHLSLPDGGTATIGPVPEGTKVKTG